MKNPPLEKAVVKRIQNYLTSIGAYHVKTTGVRIAGTPDILACYRGRFIAIEVKRPGNEKGITKLQEKRLKEVVKAGGVSIIATDVQQVKDLIAKLFEEEWR